MCLVTVVSLLCSRVLLVRVHWMGHTHFGVIANDKVIESGWVELLLCREMPLLHLCVCVCVCYGCHRRVKNPLMKQRERWVHMWVWECNATVEQAGRSDHYCKALRVAPFLYHELSVVHQESTGWIGLNIHVKPAITLLFMWKGNIEYCLIVTPWQIL